MRQADGWVVRMPYDDAGMPITGIFLCWCSLLKFGLFDTNLTEVLVN